MAEAFPLAWPTEYPRTEKHRRRRASFKAFSFAQARDSLLAEMRRLGARNPVLSTNVPLRRDGLPYANKGLMDDPGCAVYFTLKERQLVLACDRWDKIEDNMRSIELTIDAMRGMERWGCSDMLNRAFTGFTALPAPSSKQWWDVLQCRQDSSLDVINANYKRLARDRHPDNGGTDELMAELNRAVSEARALSKD